MEAVPPSLDADQTAESANAWAEAGVSPGSEFYFIDCALSALRTRKLTPVEGKFSSPNELKADCESSTKTHPPKATMHLCISLSK